METELCSTPVQLTGLLFCDSKQLIYCCHTCRQRLQKPESSTPSVHHLQHCRTWPPLARSSQGVPLKDREVYSVSGQEKICPLMFVWHSCTSTTLIVEIYTKVNDTWTGSYNAMCIFISHTYYALNNNIIIIVFIYISLFKSKVTKC